MSEIRSLEQAADSARTMQAALSLGSHINRWSLLFALLALFCLFYLPLSWLPRTGLLVSVIANGVQMLLTLRVALDEKLFRNLARQWAAASPGPPARNDTSAQDELARLDQSLVRCKLRPAQEITPRDLDSRLCGAKRLVKKQLLAFSVQFATMLVFAAIANLPPAG